MVGDVHLLTGVSNIWYQPQQFHLKDCPNPVPMLSMYERKQTLRSVL